MSYSRKSVFVARNVAIVTGVLGLMLVIAGGWLFFRAVQNYQADQSPPATEAPGEAGEPAGTSPYMTERLVTQSEVIGNLIVFSAVALLVLLVISVLLIGLSRYMIYKQEGDQLPEE